MLLNSHVHIIQIQVWYTHARRLDGEGETFQCNTGDVGVNNELQQIITGMTLAGDIAPPTNPAP